MREMKKQMMAVGMVGVMLICGCLCGCAGKSSVAETTTAEVTTSIETTTSVEATTTEEVTTTTETKDDKQVTPEIARGEWDGTYYYNPYFAFGFGIASDKWTTDIISSSKFRKFLNGKNGAYTKLFRAFTDGKSMVIDVNMYDLTETSAQEQLDKYADETRQMMKENGFTIQYDDVIQLHIGEDTYPAVIFGGEKEGLAPFHNIIAMIEKDNYAAMLVITGQSKDVVLVLANNLYRE